VTTLIFPGVQMFKYPVPGVYFRTDLGHFLKNDYHNYFWLQMCQILFFAWFPDIDSKIRETTVMPITISLQYYLMPEDFNSDSDDNNI
jgi:hypothetical protein